MEFVGTPDYASSVALMSMRPGPGGDVEALGFTLLEFELGELPWWVQGGRAAGWKGAQVCQQNASNAHAC